VQERLNKGGEQYIQAGRNTIRALWRKMCEHDGIDPEASFAVFSPDNPYQPFYEPALRQLREAEADYRNGGYVGLKIEGMRTQLPTFKKKRGKKQKEGNEI